MNDSHNSFSKLVVSCSIVRVRKIDAIMRQRVKLCEYLFLISFFLPFTFHLKFVCVVHTVYRLISRKDYML